MDGREGCLASSLSPASNLLESVKYRLSYDSDTFPVEAVEAYGVARNVRYFDRDFISVVPCRERVEGRLTRATFPAS